MKLLLVFIWCLFPRSHSLEVHEQLNNPAQESRAQILGKQLLCPSCAGQVLNDSPVEEAILLRAIIREQILKGYSDQQIIEWFVNRYGERILVSPPLCLATFMLWFSPWLILLLCLGAGYHYCCKNSLG